MSLRSVAFLAFAFVSLLRSPWPFVAAQDSLDGYSFGCGGIANFQAAAPIYAFEGETTIRCPDAFGTGTFECGTYQYDAGAGTLTGTVSGVSFSTTNHFVQDNILVSFQPDGSPLPCNVLALDWRRYFTGNAAVFLKCPAQNPIPADGSTSYEDNSWAFYETGGVWLTSRFEQVQAQNTIRRDGFGVYVFDAETERMRIYYGSWQNRDQGYLDASFSVSTGQFLADGTLPEGAACYVDSGSNMTKAVGQLSMEWLGRGYLSRVLAHEGANARVSGMFYKAAAQTVLLYGSATWV
jgi:hypothetical protein